MFFNDNILERPLNTAEKMFKSGLYSELRGKCELSMSTQEELQRVDGREPVKTLKLTAREIV